MHVIDGDIMHACDDILLARLSINECEILYLNLPER